METKTKNGQGTKTDAAQTKDTEKGATAMAVVVIAYKRRKPLNKQLLKKESPGKSGLFYINDFMK